MKNFIALNNEAAFIRSVLGIGLTEIRKANYATLGIYWQAFTNLSIGLERLSKLLILINFVIKGEGKFPENQELRKYGHDLITLYNETKNIVTEYEICIKFNLCAEIHQNILKILNGFSKGDRYANLDYLTGNSHRKGTNPVFEWAEKVDNWIWENKISKNNKEKIFLNAKLSERILGNSAVFHFNEQNEIINNICEASFRTGMWQAVSPYRCLYLIHIIKYFVSVLVDLQDRCHKQYIQVPYFNEYYALFLGSNEAYSKRRRNWTRNY